MSNILDRYGIKEVADVTFYKIDEYGRRGAPVLFLDTLKVSTIEQTAENTSARGGKGNAELIMWDYGKEINVTLEDALFSMKSLAIMYGTEPQSGSNLMKKALMPFPRDEKGDFTEELYVLYPTIFESKNDGGVYVLSKPYYFINGKKMLINTVKIRKKDGTLYEGEENFSQPMPVRNEWDYLELYFEFNEMIEIPVGANSFPGTYYITGDTYARNEVTGEDEFFQFIIPKAKVLSENTITMEAEGDPSTFNMNLKVLRPFDGEMMKLIMTGVDFLWGDIVYFEDFEEYVVGEEIYGATIINDGGKKLHIAGAASSALIPMEGELTGSYALTFSVKNTGDGIQEVSVHFNNSNYESLVIDSGDWHQARIDFSTPAGAFLETIEFDNLTGGKDLYIDDIKLVHKK